MADKVVIAANGLIGKLMSVKTIARRESNMEIIQVAVPHGGGGLTQEAAGFLSANVGQKFIVSMSLDDGTGELELERGDPPDDEPDDDEAGGNGVQQD